MIRRKKSFDPLDFTIKHGTLQVGTMGVVGITGEMHNRMPVAGQAVGSSIMRSTGTMALIPRMHAVGGVFSSLRGLEKKTRSKK